MLRRPGACHTATRRCHPEGATHRVHQATSALAHAALHHMGQVACATLQAPRYGATVLKLTTQKPHVRRRQCKGVAPPMQTRQWLTSQADRLVRTRKLLEAELGKFMHVSTVHERYVQHYAGPGDWHNTPLNPRSPKYASRGEVNLRRLMEEVRCRQALLRWPAALAAARSRYCGGRSAWALLRWQQHMGATEVAV
jgi:hypothetical protein